MLSYAPSSLNSDTVREHLAAPIVTASPYLQTAINAAANASDQIQKVLQSAQLEVEFKQDASPVTQADKAAEQAIRKQIKTDFPKHSIFGEEYGREKGAEDDFVWLIDPIDGTKCFIRQLPFYSIQIALMHRGQIIMGLSCAPLMHELAYATLGGGAFLNGKALAVSQVQNIDHCYLSVGNLKWEPEDKHWQQYAAISREVQLSRGYGDFFSYHRLASGQVDAVIEQGLNILDIAALAIIVTEAGGIFTNLQGQALTLSTESVLATATKELHQALKQRFINA